MNTPTAKPVLLEAQQLIHGEREEAYGHPADNLRNIAAQWSLYLSQRYHSDIRLLPEDVCWMMADLKKARQMHLPKMDNLIDAAGYIGLIQRCEELRPEKSYAPSNT